MLTSRRLLALVPDALLIEGHEIQPDRLIVHTRARAADGQCPLCGTRSRSVHSRYRRTLGDVPCRMELIARDRSGGYSKASAGGAPKAIQVADQWHLMANASAAFLEAVRRSMRKIRDAIGAAEIDPALFTSAERRQFEGAKRREATNAAILAFAKAGVPIKEIVRRTGYSRGTVRRVVRGGGTDMFRTRESSLDPYRDKLEAEWQGGCHAGAELLRRLRSAGFSGSLRVVTEWAARKLPSARVIAKMMTTDRDHLSIDDTHLIVTIEKAAPDLLAARDLIDQFHAMIRKGDADQLDAWIKMAKTGLLESLAIGITTDRNAVHVALSEPWSNGQTEGQISKLKLVKRQMYGRAKLDLLRARVMAAA